MADVEDDDSGDSTSFGEKSVIVGICAMAKKSGSKPMLSILTRLDEFDYIKTVVFPEETILKVFPEILTLDSIIKAKGSMKNLEIFNKFQQPIEEWPIVDCLVSFHSKGFPLEKTMSYAKLRDPFILNNIDMQFELQDRRKVYSILEEEGILLPRYAILDRDTNDLTTSEKCFYT